MAYHLSKKLVEKGAKMVGLIDYNGAIYSENGIDPEVVYSYKKRKIINDSRDPGIEGLFSKYKKHNASHVLQQEADFLFVTDKPESISHQADLVNQKIVVECIDNGVTSVALEELKNKGVLVLPDIVMNSGNLVVSIIEYFKELQFRDNSYLYRRVKINLFSGLKQSLKIWLQYVKRSWI